jgi:hypothetical protein
MSVDVTIKAIRPLAEVWLRDSHGRVVSGVSPLTTGVEPGLYRIGWKTDAARGEQWTEISAAGHGSTLDDGILPEFFVSPAIRDLTPLRDKPLALSLSTAQPSAETATEGEMLIVVHWMSFADGSKNPNLQGLRLCNASGKLLVNLSLTSEWDESLNANASRVKLEAGTYLLRAECPRGGQVEQSVMAVGGWQTRLNIVLQTSGDSAEFNVEHMFLTPFGVVATDEELSRSLLMFRKLATREFEMGELVQPVDCLKARNAALALYQAHYLLNSGHQDRVLIRDLADVGHELIGNVPDVRALDVYLQGLTAEHEPFLLPPLLQSSWQTVVNHSSRDRGIVPADCYAARACRELVRNGIWLSWKVPPAQEPLTERDGADAIVDLQAKRHRLRRAVARNSVPALDANQTRLLQIAAAVAETELKMRWFSFGLKLPANIPVWIYTVLLETVGRAVWFLPRDQARMEAEENLRAAALVRMMNMPQTAVESIAAQTMDKMAAHWSVWWPSGILSVKDKLFSRPTMRLRVRERTSAESNILMELLIRQLEASSDLLKHGYGLISVYVVVNTPLLKYRFDESMSLPIRRGLSGVGLVVSLAALTIVSFQNGEYHRTRAAIRRLIDLLGLPLPEHTQFKQSHMTIVLMIVFLVGSAGWLGLLLVNGW